MKIRRATRDDFSGIAQMGERFLQQTQWASLGLDLSSLYETLEELSTNSNGLLLVAEDEQGVCGMLGALKFPHYFNKQHWLAQELFWWVDERARGTGAGKGLLLAGEEWAKKAGAKALMMISIQGTPEAEAVAKMYSKAGYTPAEHNYVRFF